MIDKERGLVATTTTTSLQQHRHLFCSPPFIYQRKRERAERGLHTLSSSQRLARNKQPSFLLGLEGKRMKKEGDTHKRALVRETKQGNGQRGAEMTGR